MTYIVPRNQISETVKEISADVGTCEDFDGSTSGEIISRKKQEAIELDQQNLLLLFCLSSLLFVVWKFRYKNALIHHNPKTAQFIY